MNKEEEKRILKLRFRTSKKGCNKILNKLDLVRRRIEGLDLLKELDIDEGVKSELINDLKSYDEEVREMREKLDNLTDEDLDNIDKERIKKEEKVEALDDLVEY